jgi:hypothetical protein
MIHQRGNVEVTRQFALPLGHNDLLYYAGKTRKMSWFDKLTMTFDHYTELMCRC